MLVSRFGYIRVGLGGLVLGETSARLGECWLHLGSVRVGLGWR